MLLHTVNKGAALDDCLRLAPSGGIILLLEDGVLAALDSPANRKRLESAAKLHKLYVLAPDLAARGLEGDVPPSIESIGYADFVELCVRCDNIQSWF